MRTILCSLLLVATGSATAILPAAGQSSKPSPHTVDLAVTYDAQRRNLVSGASFWQQGGGAELSASLFHGFGAAIRFTAGSASNINNTGIGLTTYTTVAGPRYTFSPRRNRARYAVFAEGLAGESSATNSVFPQNGTVSSTANSFAAQVGGGVDIHLTHRLAVRAVEASWVRTAFPNATTSVQNTLQLGAGIVLRIH